MPSISVAGLDPDFSPYPDLTLNKYVNFPIAVSKPEADYPGWSDPADPDPVQKWNRSSATVNCMCILPLDDEK